MAQNYITINSVKIKQPDEGLGYSFETTYTSDSTRVQSGTMHATPMFTVESFSYAASYLTKEEMQTILQKVAKGGNFTLHEDGEIFDSLSFNMVGVNPIA